MEGRQTSNVQSQCPKHFLNFTNSNKDTYKMPCFVKNEFNLQFETANIGQMGFVKEFNLKTPERKYF